MKELKISYRYKLRLSMVPPPLPIGWGWGLVLKHLQSHTLAWKSICNSILVYWILFLSMPSQHYRSIGHIWSHVRMNKSFPSDTISKYLNPND